MAKIYARLIMAGVKTIKEVPALLLDNVVSVLSEYGFLIMGEGGLE